MIIYIIECRRSGSGKNEKHNSGREALLNYKKALEINPNSISAKRVIQNITDILNK